jgi:hypothetical protein
MQTPSPLPNALSDYNKIWYRNQDEIPVPKVSYLQKPDVPVNALTETQTLKRMQDMANQERVAYVQSYPTYMELFEDATDVFMNMMPDVLSQREPFGVAVQKNNRMRGIAVILISLGLLAIMVEILLSDTS